MSTSKKHSTEPSKLPPTASTAKNRVSITTCTVADRSNGQVLDINYHSIFTYKMLIDLPVENLKFDHLFLSGVQSSH